MTFAPFALKLETLSLLSEAEHAAIRNMPCRSIAISADQDIVREGDRASRSCFILDGLAHSFKITGEGKRQIVAFHLPGDVPDLQSLHLTRLDASVGTLTRCTVAFVQHEDLLRVCHVYPNISDALWRMTLIEAAIYREWTTNIGQRSALSRVAHLLCEFIARMGALGMASGPRYDLPVSQLRFAEATGMSAVHMNRVVQELRNRHLIAWDRSVLEVLDWGRLSGLADFSPDYLHLRTKPVADEAPSART